MREDPSGYHHDDQASNVAVLTNNTLETFGKISIFRKFLLQFEDGHGSVPLLGLGWSTGPVRKLALLRGFHIHFDRVRLLLTLDGMSGLRLLVEQLERRRGWLGVGSGDPGSW